MLSEFMDLLRLRYSLAEKVYYHHTKVIASAMLIAAVNSMVQENKLSEKSLFDMDDSILLNYLSANGTRALPTKLHLGCRVNLSGRMRV